MIVSNSVSAKHTGDGRTRATTMIGSRGQLFRASTDGGFLLRLDDDGSVFVY
jgi:hypothetical protein